MGVGPFKNERKVLKPLRGDFPSWPPEGGRALQILKDPAGGGLERREGALLEVRS